MDIPAPAAAPMDAALALLDHLESLSTEQKKEIFPVLRAMINNIVMNPLEDKYRTIKKSNKKIQATFCNQYGQVLGPVHAVLLGLNFEERPDCYVCTTHLLEVHSAAVELLEAMACSLEDVPAAAPAAASAPQASSIPRKAKPDPATAHACDLADARKASAESFKMKAGVAPPAATPSGYPAASGTFAQQPSAGPAKPAQSEFNFKKRDNQAAIEEKKAADDLAALRAERKNTFQDKKQDGSAFQGDAYNAKPSISAGGYEEGSWWNPGSWFGGGGGSSDGPNSNARRNKPTERPPGAPRMKTINDLPKPPPRGGG
jgi:hypothetical protein